MKEALTSAKLWEARYNTVETSRQEYRENAKKLVTVNDTLQSVINQVGHVCVCLSTLCNRISKFSDVSNRNVQGYS